EISNRHAPYLGRPSQHTDRARGSAMSEPTPPTEKGSTPWERFVSLARKVTQTPKAEVDKREREWRNGRKEKRQQ
ncbi:MAG TPA: hypothetical protein VK548_10415, partial [Candidatus Acidoferrum sp.]|nr:hypothetical protein [Candidatus Acidoferrum sp.]